MDYKNSISSIAIGTFDGIHLAHQRLISLVEAVVVIERNQAVLTKGHRRAKYIDKPIFFYHFDKIKSLSANEFIDSLIKDFPKLKQIVIGYDFVFGYKKSANIDTLKSLFKGEVIVIKEIALEGVSVHTRIIKDYLRRGEIEFVNKLLNHTYIIEGNIVKGQGLGAKELVPTLNLNVMYHLLPKSGVYATRTLIENRWLNSITFLGHRLTTDSSFAVETHIMNYDIGIINSGIVEIEFIYFIRNNRRFNSIDDLREQIKKDIKNISFTL